jgi:hypothetical protein
MVSNFLTKTLISRNAIRPSAPQSLKAWKKENQSQTLYHFHEFSLGDGESRFVNVPLTSSEVRNLKRELKSVLEDLHGVADQLDQFFGSQVYTWSELMSILSILFSREEREMIRRAAMIAWLFEHLSGPYVLPADVKFQIKEPHWDNNDAIHWGYMKDLRDLMIKGIQEAVP